MVDCSLKSDILYTQYPSGGIHAIRQRRGRVVMVTLQREHERKECMQLTHEVPERGLIMGHQVIDDGPPTESKEIGTT